LQPQKQWYWLDNKSYCTDLEWTIQCLEASEPSQTWQNKNSSNAKSSWTKSRDKYESYIIFKLSAT
jgi:hypothetical protein